MSNFSFKLPNGKSFEVKGPPELTLDQAKAVFDKQASTGSLVGLKPGGILNAASQAAKGLTSALSSLGQQASDVIGALGGGIASAAGQIGALATKTLNSATSIVNSTVSAVKGALTSSTPTNGISVANFSKQATALAPVGGLTTPELTGVLAQVKKTVDQAADKLTNIKGVGSYGLDIKQLETAGYVKPGTSALISAGTDVASILKSPSVFTGKDGVKDINGILSNTSIQDKAQQELMARASSGLESLGVPVTTLGATNVAGLLTSAAKSLPDVEKFAKGLALPPDVKASIDTAVSLGAYAVKLTDVKIPAVFKEETTPVPSADTTDRETVNAATNRIIGNEKIPAPNYGPREVDPAAQVDSISYAYSEALGYVTDAIGAFTEIKQEVISLEKQNTIAQASWDAVDAAYKIAKATYDSQGIPATANAQILRSSSSAKAAQETAGLAAVFDSSLREAVTLAKFIRDKLTELKVRITD